MEPYFRDCLASIARQTLRDLEVICVDDGSRDGSAAIAEAFGAQDDRFRVVRQENAGLGAARNAGALLAGGEYLCFMDSDDVLPVDAYELLISSLRASGSDFACGNVLYLNSTGTWRSGLHALPFRETLRRTHVTARPELLLDRTAWNKVFRHDFYREHGFRFPDGLYEDAPVTIPAHVLARSVDVLDDPIYYWRQREAGDPSITQSRTVPGNLEDRVASITRVRDFLAAHASPALRRRFDEFVLRSDLNLYVNEVLDADADYRGRLMENVGSLVERMDTGVLSGLPWERRLLFELVRRRRMDDFVEVLAARRQGRSYGLTRRAFGWYADHPLMRRGVLPRRVFRAGDGDLSLVCRVDQLHWRAEDHRLRVAGRAYIRGVDLPVREASEIVVTLSNPRSGRSIELPAVRTLREDVTAASDQDATCYDWSGFEADVDPAVLADASRNAKWRLKVTVGARSVRRSGWATATAVSEARRFPAVRVGPEVRLRAETNADDEVVLRVQRIQAEARARAAGGGTIEVSGWVASDATPSPEGTLRARLRRGGRELVFPAACRDLGGGRAGFTASLPVAELLPPDLVGGKAADPRIYPDLNWDLFVTVGPGRPHRLAAESADAEEYVIVGDREVCVGATRLGTLTAQARPLRPAATDLTWAPDGRLLIAGRCPEITDPRARLVLRGTSGGVIHRLPLEREGERFAAAIPLTELDLYGELVPLTSGRWEIMIEAGGHLLPVRAVKNLLSRLPGPRVAGVHTFRVRAHRAGGVAVDVQPALGADGGRYAQRRLAERDYPAFRHRPLRDLVVFESWRGRQYSDSPRAVYEELRRRGDDRECVWVSADGQVRPPGDARIVLRGSRAHYEALAHAGHVVSNDNAPEWFVKREGQVYVQTWHGTPLKRIAHDIPAIRFNNGADYLRRFSREVAKWDLLLSPNSFSTPILSRAFRYDGAVLQCGYPRNDRLHRPQGREDAARVRRALGVPADRRIVLYAPTWRDDRGMPGGRYQPDLRLDFGRARRALGDDCVFLFRGHLHTARAPRPDGADRTFLDVTAYPDVTDLLLVADVLVTDYSSIMFDYAGTGRPILLFTYDLEHYRERLRGFYLDLAEHAPGPLLGTSDEVIDALADLEGVAAAHAAAHRAFKDRFCHLDDGNAAARVVDHVFQDRACQIAC
ncbi:hypothetical protein GCM10017673_51320 [Streptosporangium violaceochromogenes]|nr:hypothetical protein GCM10017673_51320 [Streptosporangium violaceochromogenes]